MGMRNIMLFALTVFVLLAAALLFKHSRDEPEPTPAATQPDIKKVEQPKTTPKPASADIVEPELVEKLLFSPEPVMLPSAVPTQPKQPNKQINEEFEKKHAERTPANLRFHVKRLYSENELEKSMSFSWLASRESANIELLVKGLKERDSVVRSWCARFLGKSGDRSAVEPLTKALETEELEAVRNRIRKALEELGAGE